MEKLKPNLYCGDCFSVMEKIPDDSFDYVFTSPPYNRKRNDKYNNHKDISLDYFGLLSKAINETLRICSGNVFFNIQTNYYNKKDVYSIFGEFSDNIIEVIIWNKSNPMPNPHVINSFEYFLVLSKNNKSLKAIKTYTKNHFTTPVYSNNPHRKIHRAVMHPEACKYILSNFCFGGHVFDPFMGVGTTGIVCKDLNLDFSGVELNQEYFNISYERLCNVKTMD